MHALHQHPRVAQQACTARTCSWAVHAHPRARLAARAAQNPTATTQRLELWLNTKDMERTVTMDVVPEGKGQAIVIVDVVPDSAAAKAGVVRGQRVVGISDPVRDSEVWEMGDRPSLRFVRDTLRLRRLGDVQLILTDYLNVTDPRWANPGFREGTPDPAVTAQETDASPSASPRPSTPSLLDSLTSGASMSMSDTDTEDPSGAAPLTLGEKMARDYEARERSMRQVSEVKKRIAKRAAYMDEVSQRNDSPLVAGLFLAFLGPAVIILAVAAGTGYLDHLYSSSLTIR